MRKKIIASELQDALSPLESDVIQLVQGDRKVKVRDLYLKLKRKRKVAITSVAVILDRLYKKGLVERIPETGIGGVHFLYTLKMDQRIFEKNLIEQAVNKLLDKFGNSAHVYFNERFSNNVSRIINKKENKNRGTK